MHYYTDVLKKYAVFDGRATQKEFWMFALWNALINVIVYAVVWELTINTQDIFFLLIDLIYILAVLLPSIGVSIRRLHDTGHSGWWLLLYFVPLIGAITLLIFFILDSTADNQYGPNPKAVGQAAIIPQP